MTAGFAVLVTFAVLGAACAMFHRQYDAELLQAPVIVVLSSSATLYRIEGRLLELGPVTPGPISRMARALRLWTGTAVPAAWQRLRSP